MPVDSTQTTQLRVTPNAPGHVKDPALHHQSGAKGIVPTKLGDQTRGNLESLATNKHYAHVKEHVVYGLEFVDDFGHCIMNAQFLLVHLCTSLYPNSRFLDILRVIQL